MTPARRTVERAKVLLFEKTMKALLLVAASSAGSFSHGLDRENSEEVHQPYTCKYEEWVMGRHLDSRHYSINFFSRLF